MQVEVHGRLCIVFAFHALVSIFFACYPRIIIIGYIQNGEKKSSKEKKFMEWEIDREKYIHFVFFSLSLSLLNVELCAK